MSASKIAHRYAKSLIDLSQDQNVLGSVVNDISLLKEAFENNDFRNLVESPIVKADKKKSIFKAIFDGKINDLTSKYLQLIISKGRESNLMAISSAFLEQYRKMQNTSSVKLMTAHPLDEGALNSIKQKLQDSPVTDDKVELEVDVDPDLIGGFTVELEGMLYDGSVKKKLNDLKQGFSK